MSFGSRRKEWDSRYKKLQLVSWGAQSRTAAPSHWKGSVEAVHLIMMLPGGGFVWVYPTHRKPECRPGTCWRDYTSHLVLEHLRIILSLVGPSAEPVGMSSWFPSTWRSSSFTILKPSTACLSDWLLDNRVAGLCFKLTQSKTFCRRLLLCDQTNNDWTRPRRLLIQRYRLPLGLIFNFTFFHIFFFLFEPHLCKPLQTYSLYQQKWKEEEKILQIKMLHRWK